MDHELPELLVINPPPVFIVHQQQFSQKFKLLKAYESPLSTELFLQTHAQSTKAIICYPKSPITSDILRHLPSLQIVVTATAGFNHIDLPACRRRGIAVANTADVLSEDTADIAVGLLIDVLRKISSGDRFVRSGNWPTDLDHFPYLGSQFTKAGICYGKSPITSNILRHLPECRRRGIAVANTADVFSEDTCQYNTADTAVGLCIDVLRKISSGDRFVRLGNWPTDLHFPYLGSQLGGKHVGIVGLGNIGLKVATRLEAFGCKLSYNSRQKKPVPYNFYPSVCELALDCNILVICCTLNMETHHMIDKNVLTAIGKNGFLINIARGPIIDEKELVKFLVEGEIAGAGLDVFENEPKVPPELFSLDNVVLTPHRAAFTEEAFLSAFQIVLANLEAFFSNKPLISPVIHG